MRAILRYFDMDIAVITVNFKQLNKDSSEGRGTKYKVRFPRISYLKMDSVWMKR